MSRVRFIHACAILSIGTPLPPRVAFYGRRALYGRRINGKTGAARGSSTDPLWGTADKISEHLKHVHGWERERGGKAWELHVTW